MSVHAEWDHYFYPYKQEILLCFTLEFREISLGKAWMFTYFVFLFVRIFVRLCLIFITSKFCQNPSRQCLYSVMFSQNLAIILKTEIVFLFTEFCLNFVLDYCIFFKCSGFSLKYTYKSQIISQFSDFQHVFFLSFLCFHILEKLLYFVICITGLIFLQLKKKFFCIFSFCTVFPHYLSLYHLILVSFHLILFPPYGLLLLFVRSLDVSNSIKDVKWFPICLMDIVKVLHF